MFGDGFACSLCRSAANCKQKTEKHSKARQGGGRLICSRVAGPPWKMFGDGFACSPCRFAANCKQNTEKHIRLSENVFIAKTVKLRVNKVTNCCLFGESEFFLSRKDTSTIAISKKIKHRDLENDAVDNSESDGHELFRPGVGSCTFLRLRRNSFFGLHFKPSSVLSDPRHYKDLLYMVITSDAFTDGKLSF